MSCIQERAKIEKAYAQQLTDWSKRWRQLVERGAEGLMMWPRRTVFVQKSLNRFKVTILKANVLLLLKLNKLLFHPRFLTQSVLMRCLLPLAGPQYGTLERAWVALMTEAEKVSDLHQEVKNNLLNEDLEKVKNWQKEAYHKQMMGRLQRNQRGRRGFPESPETLGQKTQRGEETELCDTFYFKYAMYMHIHIKIWSSTTVFNIDDNQKCFSWAAYQQYHNDFWRIMWHWRLE